MDQRSTPRNNVLHLPTSQFRAEALDLVKWVFAVAKMPADSPRFAWYVSRWDVPRKIARAKADGTFADLTADCPPIDLAWIRFAPAALDEWRAFTSAHARPKTERPKSSSILRQRA